MKSLSSTASQFSRLVVANATQPAAARVPGLFTTLSSSAASDIAFSSRRQIDQLSHRSQTFAAAKSADNFADTLVPDAVQQPLRKRKRELCDFSDASSDDAEPTVEICVDDEKDVASRDWQVVSDHTGRNLDAFQRNVGVRAIQDVLDSMFAACSATGQGDLWDNYGWREYLVNQWIRQTYGFADIRRSSGRSGPDCETTTGERSNIEVKTSLFKKRSRLTRAYELGQFSRQHTTQIRDAAHQLDAVVYAIFQNGSTLPICLFCLHSRDALDVHSNLIASEQQRFLKTHAEKSATSHRGGRDTIRIKAGKLCLALSHETRSASGERHFQPLAGFEVWVHGEQCTDWNLFTKQIVEESGVLLLSRKAKSDLGRHNNGAQNTD